VWLGMGRSLKGKMLMVACAGVLTLGVMVGAPGGHASGAALRHAAGYSAKILYGVAAEDARAAIKVWIEQIVRPRFPGLHTETMIFPDVSSLKQAVAAKEVDMVVLLAEEFLEVRDTIALDPLVVPETVTGDYVEFLLLVPARRTVEGVFGLRQQKILLEKGQRGSLPLLWVDTLLMERGLPGAKSYFGSVRTVEKPLDTVLPVFLGQADCCVIGRDSFATMVELNPQLGKDLVPIFTFPKFGIAVTCCRQELEKPFRYDLFKSLLEVDRGLQGKQMLTFFRVKKLLPYNPGYLKEVEDLFRRHAELAAKGGAAPMK
jgi:hypothetical protein